MHSRFLFFSLFFLLSFRPLWAAEVTPGDVEKVAEMHLRVQMSRWVNAIEKGLIEPRALDYTISDIRRLRGSPNGVTLGYIVDLSPAGFISISADSTLHPVIAFAYKGRFSTEETEDNIILDILKRDLSERFEALHFMDERVKKENLRLWGQYIRQDPVLTLDLIQASQWPITGDGWLGNDCWDQGGPHNSNCPIDPKTKTRSLVGCTATALAQILNYWKYPNTATFDDNDNYKSVRPEPGDGKGQREIWIDVVPDGKNDGKATAEHEYDLNSAMNQIPYGGSNQFKADLSFAAGVTVKAQYSSKLTSAGRSEKHYKDKWKYTSADYKHATESDFYQVLKANMIKGWPAHVDVWKHSIVADGYREKGVYHLNFGWGCSNPTAIDKAWYALPGGLPPPRDKPPKHNVYNAVLNICAIHKPAKISYHSVFCGPSFSVSWSYVSKADAYELQRARLANFSDAVTIYSGPNNYYFESNYTADKFYYQARAINSCGKSEWASGGAIYAQKGPPGKPANISTPLYACDTQSGFMVKWSPGKYATGYQVQRAIDYEFSNPTTIHKGPGSSVIQAGLSSGRYYYRVKSSNLCGHSDWVTTSSATMVGTPPAPTFINYDAVDCDGNFHVQWGSSAVSMGSVLDRATNAAFTNATQVYTGNKYSYREKGLAKGTYYYRAKTVNLCGESPLETGGEIRIGQPKATQYKSPANSETKVSTQPKLEWSPSAGAYDYHVYFGTASTLAVVDVVNNTFWYPGKLHANTTYYWKVEAQNGCGKASGKVWSFITGD